MFIDLGLLTALLWKKPCYLYSQTGVVGSPSGSVSYLVYVTDRPPGCGPLCLDYFSIAPDVEIRLETSAESDGAKMKERLCQD